MPTEQEVIDAVVLDEEVPHFIVEANREIMAQFRIAKTRRGKRRDEAIKKLTQLVEEKLHSQYRSYVGLIGHLKLKSTKKWIAEDCSKQVVTLTKSIDKLIYRVQYWKNEYQKAMEENSELSIKIKGIEKCK